MILGGVLETCRAFDRAVVELELNVRVVLRSSDATPAKIARALVLFETAVGELCAFVRGAKLLYELHRGRAGVDEVRQAGERIALVQLVLAHRCASLTMGKRVLVKLCGGKVSRDDAEAWAQLFFGLASMELPVEAWTDDLKIPATAPAVEA